ncbi:MAG: glycosyltransferase [Flavobacteriales bacterium]|nr:glycosyltransferase [Flavobacteriales bacterium]
MHNLHGTSIPLDELAEISKRIPVLFTLHDSWLTTGSIEHPFEPDPEKLNLLDLISWKREFSLRNKVVARGNFHFTAPSQWMRELFFTAYGIRPYYVPNAIKKAEPNEVEIPSERFILFVANRPETNPYKDFATLKKAWNKANEKLGENGCDLIVLGGESKTEKVRNRTFFIMEKQSTDSVLAFMGKSLIVVQASLQDNAPLTILEAHSIGKNVVGSMVGGIPELMTEQEHDWLYEAGNADDLCERLILAIESESKETSQFVHTVESMVNTYLGHYLSFTDA